MPELRLDEFTKAAPHRFGAGKINAYKGLLYVLDLSTGIQGLSQKQPDNITFRVENGQLIAEGAEDGTAVTLYNLSGGIVVLRSLRVLISQQPSTIWTNP